MSVAVGRLVLVGLGEAFVTSESGKILEARFLGSTAALAVHDPVAGVGGLLHWMLPESRIDAGRAKRKPDMFADAGIPRLLQALEDAGGQRSRLHAVLAGAANLPEGGHYDIGARNHQVATRLLQDAGVALLRDETGGVWVRDLSLEMEPGEFRIRSQKD